MKFFSYLEKSNNKKRTKNKRSYTDHNNLSCGMYKIEYAVQKILSDRNLAPKIKYIEHILEISSRSEDFREHRELSLELHCAVVCCDISNRKILIVERTKSSSSDTKWEFGCAKADSSERLVNTIKKYYANQFGVEIELCMIDERSEEQPKPIAIYEINKKHTIRKGIIFAGSIKNLENINYENLKEPIKAIKLASFDEIKAIATENAVTDFHQTAKYVFDNWDELFGKEN